MRTVEPGCDVSKHLFHLGLAAARNALVQDRGGRLTEGAGVNVLGQRVHAAV
jgi:hypothetical protein